MKRAFSDGYLNPTGYSYSAYNSRIIDFVASPPLLSIG
jgi:hypothetical protein